MTTMFQLLCKVYPLTQAEFDKMMYEQLPLYMKNNGLVESYPKLYKMVQEFNLAPRPQFGWKKIVKFIIKRQILLCVLNKEFSFGFSFISDHFEGSNILLSDMQNIANAQSLIAAQISNCWRLMAVGTMGLYYINDTF